ncbi:MAG: hypothetical protein GIW99_05555 [Candidatus Eremiobacteraeota bacterium]|nr:hypothetical protein [Candidatus Eremiobacteraeota bacterium]MBC5827133.1 hypothetical protein [Candidatus Eremiobacteraeota bacterium]
MAIDVEHTHGDRYEVPRSRGIPPTVRLLVAIGLVIIFYMGAISAFYSKHFHIWPAGDTSKITLTGKF